MQLRLAEGEPRNAYGARLPWDLMAAALHDDTPVEMPVGEHAAPFLMRPIEAHDGWVSPPTGLGLGVEVDESSLERYRYDPRVAEPFLLH